MIELFSKNVYRFILTGILVLLFGTTSTYLNAQTGISIQSRHVLNPEDEIRLRDYVFNNSFLDFQGVVVSLFRGREKRLYEFALGFNSTSGSVGVSRTPEYFAQLKFRMFKNLFTKPQGAAFFSIGPRLFFMNGSIASSTTVEFSRKMQQAGIEVPIIFNFEHYFNNRIWLLVSANVLSPVLFADRLVVDNPNVEESLRSSAGFNLSLGLLNELRLGVGYLLNKPNEN